jgi:hypothetical protein
MIECQQIASKDDNVCASELECIYKHTNMYKVPVMVVTVEKQVTVVNLEFADICKLPSIFVNNGNAHDDEA